MRKSGRRRTCLDQNFPSNGRRATASMRRSSSRSDEVSRGPGLLFTWGHGGTETAFWTFVLARLLKKRFATFTSSRRAHFLVADWPRLTVHPRPTSLRCFESAAAGVRVLVEARATSPQQSERLWRRRKSQSKRKTVSPTSRVAAAQVPGFTAQHGGY